MKQVIDGKLYNTETAELLHEWSNGKFTSDFGHCAEALYKTKKGAYFIAGEGGAMTGYARSCGTNSTCGGSGIRVLTEVEAMEWLENHEGTEALEQYFGDKIDEA
ncbi:MAG TPA: hypothetical protein ACFYEK_04260 [Candidatus Wunengus sp. YC60]|uniref:hypothetical protein n=1 Tax=Candidatus Wunengus sp. YC60 TaxID=3367697 RepID=UPI004024BBC5